MASAVTSAPTSANLARTARLCRALSDENRLRIIGMLTSGERCVCELTAALDLGQSLLSHHLKTLKDAGVVTDRREGRWVYYTLNCDALDELGTSLESLTPPAGVASADNCCR
jgi:ArsR family transcriptional regulator, arsenate/arsenite/antimonite-responsive transcriptional repressor